MPAGGFAISSVSGPGVLVAVVGPSGVGKDSILREAARALPSDGRVVFARRVITRPPDATEDHQVVDEAAFERMAADGAFALSWQAHGLHYGVPAGIVDDIAAGRTVIVNISRTVIGDVRERFRRSLVISIEAPGHVLAERLKSRGRETESDRAGRLARNVSGFDADVLIENAGHLSDAVKSFVDEVMAASARASATSQARYAVYLAPDPASALWATASDVIGYNAATGATGRRFVPEGMTAAEWTELTRSPATYGFHATLKAPFRLAPQRSVEGLIEALSSFCGRQPSFPLGPLAVRPVGGHGGAAFVALIPTAPPAALTNLERAVVTEFDVFRAPLTNTEVQRRRPERLTQRQREFLNAYGYPFVHDEFRCHFTLTGSSENAAHMAAMLQRHFDRTCGSIDFVADALVLFEQSTPGAPFRIIRRVPFGAVA